MTCYICCEETKFISPCQCNGLYLCLDCLEKLRIYKFRNCTICEYPYPPPESGYDDESVMSKEEIDAILDRLEARDSMWHLFPVNCRPRRYREKRILFLELSFHGICIYGLSCVVSQIEKSSIQWYELCGLHSVVIGFFIYLGLLAIANSICIKR